MTDKELYETLVKKGYDESDINQLLKAREEGYNIYNMDIKLSTDQIREFRKFLKENIEVGMDHMQLREILLGWKKGLDVFQYCDKKYSGAEMSILRKAIENNKDINLIKKYGLDKESMLEVTRAIGFGCTEEDLKKYNITQLKLFNDYQKRKIDLRNLLDKGFNKEQIDYILQFEKTDKNFASYITKDFHFTTIMQLGYLLNKYPYEKIKPLFHPKTSILLANTFEVLLNDNITGWEKYYKPEFYERTLLIANCLKNGEDEELINQIFNSNSEDYIYSKINVRYYKEMYSREQFESLCYALHKNLNLENLFIEGLDKNFYPIILELEKFNKQNERQIDIKSLIYPSKTAKQFAEIAVKLMSPSLEDNIAGFRQMSDPKKETKDNIIEK